MRTGGGWTALAAACAGGHDVTAKYLLQAGADPDQRDDLGRTLLHDAAEDCRWDVSRQDELLSSLLLLARSTRPVDVMASCEVLSAPEILEQRRSIVAVDGAATVARFSDVTKTCTAPLTLFRIASGCIIYQQITRRPCVCSASRAK